MSPATVALLLEFVVMPLIKELADRRGVSGVTEDNLKALAKDPEKVLERIKADPGLQRWIITDLADGIDSIGSCFIDAIKHIFLAFPVTGSGEDTTEDDT